MTKTTIEWADEVWNPVTGCTKVSQGCKHCYAERLANRFWGERKFTDVQVHPERLEDPLKWKKPRRVFVNSMSDLFHDDVPLGFINLVFTTIAECPQHTFMILTKRPKRMRTALVNYAVRKNVWLGVSCEDQKTADERIPLLLQTPAAVRFVSCEPLLGPIDISGYLGSLNILGDVPENTFYEAGLDWVIVGGESGPGARPMHPNWARSLRDQCVEAEVPFFVKQWGEWAYCKVHEDSTFADGRYYDHPRGGKASTKYSKVENGYVAVKVGKKAAGRLLDGKEWNEFPGGEG